MTLEAGSTVDRYTLVAPLGEGGQGQVWQAMDPLNPGKNFALKLLWLDAASPADIERARREAHHLARLAHPALPSCHALFEDLRRNLLGLVLDLVDGTPLEQVVGDPRLDPERIRALVARIASGLAYLHAEGLVHRDIKPQNILLAPSFWDNPEDPYSVRIIDLGISVPRGNPRPLTVIGRLIGTPPFMPPEQIDPVFWRFADDTPAADVFALGVVAWWLLFQQHPTQISLQDPLPSFARAYRTIAQEGHPWPPASQAPWSEFFRLTLALSQEQRASSAAALVPLLEPGIGALPSWQPGPPLVTGEASPFRAPATGPALSLGARPTPPPQSAQVAPSQPLPATIDDLRPVLVPRDEAIPQLPPSFPAPPSEPAPVASPRRGLLLGIGALIGALVMLFLVLLLRPWLRRRPKRVAPRTSP